MGRTGIWLLMVAAFMGATAFRRDPAASSAATAGRNRIAFSRIGPIRSALFMADGDGQNDKPLLPAEGLDYNASLSPDGQWVVFTSERGGSADIYRVRLDGTRLERLTDDPAFDDQGALSPDGLTLAFVSTRRGGMPEIRLLDLVTGKSRNLADQPGNFRPSWSPDGKWIAFTSDRDTPPAIVEGRWEFVQSTILYVIRTDGTGLRRLTPAGGFAGSPKWSPDGRRIVYYETTAKETWPMRARATESSTSQIVSVDVASGARTSLTSGPGIKLSPQWLGADRVAYVTKWGADPGLEFTSSGKGARGDFRNPAWSADGRHVVYHRQMPAERHRMTPAFSRQPGFDLLLTEFFAAFSPSGDRVVVSLRSAEPVPGDFQESTLESMSAEGGDRVTLFSRKGENALAPAWSPLGDQIVFGLGTFFFQAGSPARLAVIKPDGSDFRLITSGETGAGFPSWSPDGKRIVYRSDGNHGRGLVILSLEDGRTTPLTSGPQFDNFPRWSPDGERITFTSNRSGDFEIYSITPAGTGLRRLTYSPGNDSHSVWSPDGAWIAFSSARTGFKDEAPLVYRIPQPYGELFLMRSDGTGVRQLTDNQWEDALPVWVPEGARVPRSPAVALKGK